MAAPTADVATTAAAERETADVQPVSTPPPPCKGLAPVQVLGALPLKAMQAQGQEPPKSPSPCPSPYAASSYSCGSPWSPATPAVYGGNAFGLSGGGSPTASPGPSPMSNAGGPQGSPMRLVLGPVVPGGNMPTRVVMPAMPQLRGTGNTPKAATAVPHVVRTSPVVVQGVAMSPGAAIRQNAVTFGIPLDLRPAPQEIAGGPVPVPVRLVEGGAVLAPSPTARVDGLPSPPTFGLVPEMPQLGSGPPLAIRRIVTPQVGSLPRSAAGGA